MDDGKPKHGWPCQPHGTSHLGDDFDPELELEAGRLRSGVPTAPLASLPARFDVRHPRGDLHGFHAIGHSTASAASVAALRQYFANLRALDSRCPPTASYPTATGEQPRPPPTSNPTVVPDDTASLLRSLITVTSRHPTRSAAGEAT